MTHRRHFLVLLLVLAIVGLPQTAHAQLTLQNCTTTIHQKWEYTSTVVDCVQTAIEGATDTMMGGLSDYMLPTVGAAMVLAIAIFGIRVISGDMAVPKIIGFVLRAAIVLFFSYNLGGFSDDIFAIDGELTTLVSSLAAQIVGGPGDSPWGTIDYFLGQLFGFGQGVQLYQGMLGLIVASLFTSVPGMMMAGAAVMGIVKLLFFVFDVVYIYLSALIITAFMIILSPLVVPLALFQQAERYTKKWIDILIMSIITPMLLFAFLTMFLGIFSLLVDNIFTSVGGNDFRAYWRLNQPTFSKVIGGAPLVVGERNELDAQGEAIAAAAANGAAPPIVIPAVPGNITPQLSQAFDTGSGFMTPGVDFGPDTTGTMQALGFDFVALAIFAAIMQTMLHGIPQIASSIAGVLTQVPFQIGMSPKERLREMAGNAEFGLKVGSGAIAGGIVAAGLTKKATHKPMARNVGGIIGGFAASAFGRFPERVTGKL